MRRLMRVIVSSLAVCLLGLMTTDASALSNRVVSRGRSTAPVSALRASHVSKTSVVITWKNPTFAGFSGTLVRRGTAASGVRTTTAGALAGRLSARRHSLKLTGLRAGTRYVIAVWTRGV